MKRIMLLAAGLLLCAAPLCAQIIDHGQELPTDLWGPVTTTPAQASFGGTPVVDVEMDDPRLSPRPPVLQMAHSGVYTDTHGLGMQLIYQHFPNGAAEIKLLIPGNTWLGAFGNVSGSQALLPLYLGDQIVGSIKIGATTVGAPCGKLKARASFGSTLLFPIDGQNPFTCLPIAGQDGSIGSSGPYCQVELFSNKFGALGSEACDLSR